jgi:hypothetical protein
MKTAHLGLVSLIVGFALLFISCRQSSTDGDKLAVAAAFGQFTGLLLSTNQTAAYEMMSSDFRATHSFSVFEARNEHGALTRMFTNCDWNAGASVHLSGATAALQVKYNVSFSRIYHFRKEDGRWRFTDKTRDYESP